MSIDGAEPVDLILDTGATLTCLDTPLVRRLLDFEREVLRLAAPNDEDSPTVREPAPPQASRSR